METTASYAAIAATRRGELAVRLLLAAFIALAGWLLAPSFWPVLWFAAVAAVQFTDRLISDRIIAQARLGPSRALVGAYLASTFLCSTVYASIAGYMWFLGGQAGCWFAITMCAGGMLHVSLRSYASPAMLIFGAVPHALWLFGLLIASAVLGQTRDVQSAVVVLGAALYVTQLVTGVRQSRQATASLHAANAEANAARELAERASAAKSEFLATVSHEIRTPMNAVISAAHLLKRTPLNAEQQEHVAMLTNGGEVLVGLLNDVLDISKIEAGKMVLDQADLDLAEALDSLVKLYQPKTEAKGVELVLSADAGLPDAIRTDPLRLRQILFNLVSNAVKFTDQGRITIAAACAQEAGRPVLSFEVTDTGIGIDADAMGRLFGSFEQAKAETARNHGGTGLGLAISRKLAEMMGGSLTCESTVGEGSTFRLILPLVEGARQIETELAEAVELDVSRPLSILVAEDHEVNRKIVSLFLEPLGWRLTMAKDGGEAVVCAEKEVFDAILMDMQMPVLNGVDAALAIRASNGLNADTPIIALTANALGHHREAWEPVGVAGFLTKPINPDLLVDTLVAATVNRSSRANAEAA